MNAKAHLDAVAAQIELADNLRGRGDTAARVDHAGQLVRANYWIVFGGRPEDLDDDRFTAPQQLDSIAEYVFTVRSVAVDADGALDQADAIAAQLVGAVVAVEGRSLDPMRATGSDPVAPDNRVSPPLFYCDDEYTVVSRRA